MVVSAYALCTSSSAPSIHSSSRFVGFTIVYEGVHKLDYKILHQVWSQLATFWDSSHTHVIWYLPLVSTKTLETSSPYELWIHNFISTPSPASIANRPNKKIQSDAPSTSQSELSQIELKLEQPLQNLVNDQALHHRTRVTLETTRATLKTTQASLDAEFTIHAEAVVLWDNHHEANNTLTELVNTLRGELNDVRALHTNLDTELLHNNTIAFLQTQWKLE